MVIALIRWTFHWISDGRSEVCHSSGSRSDLDPGTPEFKTSSLLTQPRYILKHLKQKCSNFLSASLTYSIIFTINENKFQKDEISTFHLYLTAFQPFHAFISIAAPSADASYEISFLFAFMPTLPSFFIITVLVRIRMTLWTAALCFFHITQIILSTYSHTVQVITVRTESPAVVAEKE